jgi:GNAT superfamily N-acetyltransferase
MPDLFLIRQATVDDAPLIARHRAAMFLDMGELAEPLVGPLVDASATYLTRAIPSVEYVGWLAVPPGRPEETVASAGLLLRPQLPRPDATGRRLLHGPQGLILNVYTEPTWRRRGLAALLMRHVLDWAAGKGIEILVLQASSEGRSLYEKLGFAPTTEMQYLGPHR